MILVESVCLYYFLSIIIYLSYYNNNHYHATIKINYIIFCV